MEPITLEHEFRKDLNDQLLAEMKKQTELLTKIAMKVGALDDLRDSEADSGTNSKSTRRKRSLDK